MSRRKYLCKNRRCEYPLVFHYCLHRFFLVLSISTDTFLAKTLSLTSRKGWGLELQCPEQPKIYQILGKRHFLHKYLIVLICGCEFSLDMRCPSSLYLHLFYLCFLHLIHPQFPQGEKMFSLTHSQVC